MKSEKTVAIIQARMGSTRFPGKTMALIEGQPMLRHVVDRTKAAHHIDGVVVATSTDSKDDAIADYCAKNGIAYFRGNEKDVLDRFYQAARTHQASTIVRLTSDCPLIDGSVIDQTVECYRNTKSDYANNVDNGAYPDGFDTEVFSFSALERAWREAKKPSEREHVTPYLRATDLFKTAAVEKPLLPLPSHVHWSVDEPADLAFIQTVYAKAKGSPMTLQTILKNGISSEAAPKATPNAGYYKSLYDQASGEAAKPLTLTKSQSYFTQSLDLIPGASQTFSKSHLQYVRGACPLFLKSGKGCKVTDVDGNEYIDYVQSLLANILGYAHTGVNEAVSRQLLEGNSFSLPHPIEIELARKLKQIIPCAEKVRFGKNGSDATAGAVRAARAFTNRERVAVCGYHGWQDWYIGSTTRHRGIPESVRALTQPFTFNQLDSLKTLLNSHPGEFAAVVLEPMNFTEPAPGFLQGVKDLCHEAGALLIFDEICSGFHFGLGGAQKIFGVTPDLACFGKAMGNGQPISCIVGRADVMAIFEEIFFSFTFGGEASALAAALKVIEVLETTDALAQIELQGRTLQSGFLTLAKEAGLEAHFGTLGRPQWTLLRFFEKPGTDSLLLRGLFQQECAKRGVLLLTSHNVSAAHNRQSTQKTLEVYASVFKRMKDWLAPSQIGKLADRLEGTPIQPIFKLR